MYRKNDSPRKCANFLKETVENLGGQAKIWPFEVSGYKINKALLSANGKNYEVSGVKYTAVEESTRESFDSAKFKKDNPDLYEKYKKTSKVKPSLRVKVVEQ